MHTLNNYNSRAFTAVGILYAGIIWLANTASITELMLNAVALGSVMEAGQPAKNPAGLGSMWFRVGLRL